MRALMLGDIVGRPGREALKSRLREIRRRFGIDLVIANGENAAGGIGLTAPVLKELFAAGVDVVTSGNHIWRHADIYPVLESEERIIRPANMPAGAPGRGHTRIRLENGPEILVVNLIGRTFMEALDCPFAAAEAILAETPDAVRLRFVDFHAEASSEKRAMGFFLDGRVSALAGTHTHVQTADAHIFPGGMAYITDLGMCGNERASILGMDQKAVLARFTTGLPARFTPAPGTGAINGLLLDLDTATGKADSVSLFRDSAPRFTDPSRHSE